LRHRVYLVILRTRIKNKIHEFKNLFTCDGIEFLSNLKLDKKGKLMINDYLETLINLNIKINRVSRVINIVAAQEDVKSYILDIERKRRISC